MDKDTIKKILKKDYISRGDRDRISSNYSDLYDFKKENEHAVEKANAMLEESNKYGSPKELFSQKEKLTLDLDKSLSIIENHQELIELYKKWLEVNFIAKAFYKLFGHEEFDKLWEK